MMLAGARSVARWEDEGGSSAPQPIPVAEGAPFRGIPRFLNDAGSASIDIAVTAFTCIGASPPQDHPHIYLDMGDRGEILCPYCATRFRADATLFLHETRPPGCFHDDRGAKPALSSSPHMEKWQ